MRLLILSRGPYLYSTQSLLRAARRRGHHAHVIDFMSCEIVLGEKPEIWYDGRPLDKVDAVIPRVGASVTGQGAAVIRQFELMGIATSVRAEALLRARDKLWAFQALMQGGVSVPKTSFSQYTTDPTDLIDAVGGLPVVIKLLQGTHGMGVILAEKRNTAQAIMEAFYKSRQRFVVQQFIQECSGSDIRVLVVDGRVVAAMKRKALAGDFRANLHRGGKGIHIKLTSQEEEAALRSAELLGLEAAGVDMLQSDRGPLVLEVNASPGLEGIETITRKDVAGKIIGLMEKKVGEEKHA